jgi:hypothetical protein
VHPRGRSLEIVLPTQMSFTFVSRSMEDISGRKGSMRLSPCARQAGLDAASQIVDRDTRLLLACSRRWPEPSSAVTGTPGADA